MQVGRSGTGKVPSIASANYSAGENIHLPPWSVEKTTRSPPRATLAIEARPSMGALLNHSNEGDQ
jgi:hypothetical protein